MAYFTIDKTTGKGNNTINVTPDKSLTGRGPYTGTVTVASVDNKDLKKTVSLSKTLAVSAKSQKVSGCSTATGTFTDLTVAEGSVSVPCTAYYVKYALTTNAKYFDIAGKPVYLAIKVGTQWVQADGNLGTSQANCAALVASKTAVNVPGDIGSKNEYAAEIITGVAENKTEAAVTHTQTISVVGSVDTDKIQLSPTKIVQAKGAKTYSDITITAFTYKDIQAAGGKVTPTVTYSQTWGWNGNTTNGGTLTSGAAVSYSGTGVNATTGEASAATLGTTIKDRSKITTATVTVAMNGKTATKAADVYQAANAKTTITYGVPTVTLTVTDIPAAGGTVSSGTVAYSQTQTQNYTSGATSALAAITTGGTVAYSAAVTAPSLGTTVKERTKVGTLTATVTLNRQKGSKTVDVYQQANTATTVYGVPSITLTVADIPAAGGSVKSGTVKGTQARTQSYTSGATSALSAVDVTVAATYSAEVKAASLGTTVKVRTKVGTLTATVVQNGKTGTAAADVYQQANEEKVTGTTGGVTTYGDVTAGAITNATIPAKGGEGTATAGNGSQTWSKSAVTTSYSYTSGATRSAETAKAESGSSQVTPSAASITASAPTKGTVVSAQTVVKQQEVTWTANGKSAKGTMFIYQAANSATYGDVIITGTATAPDIPAAGGTSKGTGLTAAQTVTFTSTATRAGSVTGVWSEVMAASLKDTIKVRTKVGVSTYTATGEGSKSATKAVDVYQQENKETTITYGAWSDISVTASVNPIAKTGGTSVLSGSQTRTRKQNYTSTYQKDLSAETNATFTWTKVSGDAALTISGNTVTATANATLAARSAVFRATANSKTKDITISQSKGDATLSVSPETLTFPRSGGEQTFTITSNDSWTIS